MRSWTLVLGSILIASGCHDRPDKTMDAQPMLTPRPVGNPFAAQLVEGSPPPPEKRGTLDFRIVHAPGGSLHQAYVAILRAGTSEVVWTDLVSATKLPLGAGRYDIRIDRLGGPIVKTGIVVRAGEVTRVELASDTGALKLEALDEPDGTPKAARLRVAPAATFDFLWNGLQAEAALVLPAGTYDVHCEKDSRKGLVRNAQVRAGTTSVARCVLR